jgi:hypothetical protein
MNEKHEELTLANLGNGGAIELFEEELKKILENILDPNTKAKAKRELTLKVTFVPNADRDSAEIEVECRAKPAPMNSASATIFLGRRKGQAIAITHDPEQFQIQWDEESKPRNVNDERKEA